MCEALNLWTHLNVTLFLDTLYICHHLCIAILSIIYVIIEHCIDLFIAILSILSISPKSTVSMHSCLIIYVIMEHYMHSYLIYSIYVTIDHCIHA